ncbi:3-hydroxyacyl-CoA dehydrogenase/enoyl-CoA hydratase family protein, partial [Myxococcota bacterium]|nr:3-hydroxyacyl-CoA dehydrogenase/enoyl-CoA hydratase family protein [Myxococcota bacterium]
MRERFESAAVIGAGVMGSAIAGHLAGAGIRVHLLDIVPPDLEGDAKKDPRARSAFAEKGLKGLLKSKPAALYSPDAARLITPGNLEDHLDQIADCDLVIEAVIERMDIKKSLFAKLAEVTGPDTILASNTSGLSIADIGSDLDKEARERLIVLHFFNPVRYMRLLEVVPGPETSTEVFDKSVKIGEMLGKGIVYGKDTTNFVANRIGVFAMMQMMHTMVEDGLSLTEVDKIAGPPMGRPKSAVFRTGDLVGIDTLVHVAANCYDSLPDDEARDVFKVPEWIQEMVKNGLLGAKTRAGFYKKAGKEILAIDPATGEYKSQEKVKFDSVAATKGKPVGKRIATLISGDDKAAKFAWKVLSKALVYSATRMGEIADDIVNIDRAMRWGFNWDLGPFEVWDAIGVADSVKRMQDDGMTVPAWVIDMLESGRTSFYDGTPSEYNFYDVKSKKEARVSYTKKHIRLDALKDDKKRIVRENAGASLVDLGDGALCLELHTKMNTVDGDVIEMMNTAVDEAEKNFEAIVIGNDGEHFSAGANLMLIYGAAQQKDWKQIEGVVRGFQAAGQRLRYAQVPVVAAPFQFAFGGGAEIAMAANAIQAHAETYIGLVEVGAGLVPAGGGCLRLVERWTAGLDQAPNVD